MTRTLSMTVSGLLSSDILLAVFLPLVILFIGLTHLPIPTFSDLRNILSLKSNLSAQNRHPIFSLRQAHASFSSYATLSERELSAKFASYATLNRANKRLARKIGYEQKLKRAKEVIHLNAIITEGISELAEDEMPSLSLGKGTTGGLDSTDLSRVRESLNHFVRDWSEEGKDEREKIFNPILEVLRCIKYEKRKELKVLVPGCGLGRLAWDVSQLGKKNCTFTRISNTTLDRLRDDCKRPIFVYAPISAFPTFTETYTQDKDAHSSPLRALVFPPTH
jgi:hypothetical protein